MPRSALFRTMTLFGGMFLTGCASIHTKTPEGQSVSMSEAEFAAYVEHVFRHHNQVYSELINNLSMIEEDGVMDPGSELIQAEQEMIHVCLPLNEIVSASIEGKKPSLKAQWQLSKSVPACESATRRVETMLPRE